MARPRTRTLHKPKDGTGVSVLFESNVDAFKKLSVDLRNRALNRIAILWHGEARNAAPVDTGRLRSSIAFSTPTNQAPVTLVPEKRTKGGRPPAGDTQSTLFEPPAPPPGTAIVGSNVNYAAAVHEGATYADRAYKVRRHKRRITQAFGEKLKRPKTVQVRAHTSRTGTRITKPMKFIEGPGRLLSPRFKEIVEEEMAKMTDGPTGQDGGGE